MDVEDINVPDQEPGLEDRAPQGNVENAPDATDGLGREPEFNKDHTGSVKEELKRATVEASGADAVKRTQLPFWIAEKFFWKESATGRAYLSPNAEFLAAIIADAHGAAEYGVTKLVTEDSQEQMNVEQLVEELAPVFETLKAIDEREYNDMCRWLVERVTRNACYAAITQFELTNWAARAAETGKDAHDHQNFGVKEARMQSFATAAGIYFKVVTRMLPTTDLSETVFAKQAKKLIYQQADMNTRDQLNPKEINAQDKAKVDAAVLGVKRF